MTRVDLAALERNASAASNERNGDNWVMADIGPPRPTEVLALIARIRELQHERDTAVAELALQQFDVAGAVAEWLLGYGDEPVDARIAAQAIRDGKWRAS